MNRILFVCWCLLLGSARAETEVFAEANQRLKSGDSAGAVEAYEKLLATDGPRASVYYNLGNAYQQLKRYGPAILAYERAKLLTPRDPDLLANLALARKAAAAFEESRIDPRLDAALNFLSRHEWSWLVAGSALFLGVLAVAGGSGGLKKKGSRQSALISAAATLLLIIVGATVLYLRRDEARRGVVLTENAAVHLSPFETAAQLGTPGQGRIVHMLGRSGDFHYVEVPGTNLKGWLANREVAAITDELPAASGSSSAKDR